MHVCLLTRRVAAASVLVPAAGALFSLAQAGMEPPGRTAASDTSTVHVEKGVEFVRVTEVVGASRCLPGTVNARAFARWRTDWQTPQGGEDRIRQDGRWYAGVSRPLVTWVDVWIASAGEHFDDRPRFVGVAPAAAAHVTPRSPELETSPSFLAKPTANAVRILRGAGGISGRPWRPLTVDLGAGPVHDRRIGYVRSGLGVWSHAALDHYEVVGYDQTLSVEYNRETPQNHRNDDLTGRYEVFREFFPGNTNRAEVSAGALGRDVTLTPGDRTSRREERRYAVRDALTYGLAQGVRVEMSGEILHQKTEQSEVDVAASLLEESQAGFAAALAATRGHASTQLEMAVRSVTQTIRGDILQGRKTDLSLRSRALLPDRSVLTARLAVSKYSLDTRSKNDDRDELRYSAEAAWQKPLFRTVIYELQALARLDHLVYLFSQSSANNRWTRYFLFGTAVRHRAARGVEQMVRANVSANYQDYDFEAQSLDARSTVHRRFALSDSVGLTASSRVSFAGRIAWQSEEFGRLFWDSFEEERSDETRSLLFSLETTFRLTSTLRAGAGALWDSRRGERFPGPGETENLIFQDLRSYGPSVRLERSVPRGFFLALSGRALRQHQLQRDDRWIITGDLLGGVRW